MNNKIVWSEQPFDPKEYLQKVSGAEDMDMNLTLINTMFGVESVLDPFSSVYHLKIYRGDTNFTITKQIVDKIRTCEGVEFYRTVSRYRFVIAFGHCFDPGQCKTDIELRILNDPNVNQINDVLEELKLGMEINNIDYVLYERDGKITYRTSDQENFQHYVENLETAYKKYGGRFYKSS